MAFARLAGIGEPPTSQRFTCRYRSGYRVTWSICDGTTDTRSKQEGHSSAGLPSKKIDPACGESSGRLLGVSYENRQPTISDLKAIIFPPIVSGEMQLCRLLQASMPKKSTVRRALRSIAFLWSRIVFGCPVEPDVWASTVSSGPLHSAKKSA